MSLGRCVINLLQIVLTTEIGPYDPILDINQVMLHGQPDCFLLTMDPELAKDFLEVIAYRSKADASGLGNFLGCLTLDEKS